jgi:hypothetical protein
MAESKPDVGFGKKLRGVWLDSALEYAASGKSFDEVRQELAASVAAYNSGPEAIRKVLSSVKRVWFTPPAHCVPLRDAALHLFRANHSADSRRLLNWGMSIAAYPFVGACAESFGRLLRLQADVKVCDLERRVKERFGDREFVRRVARYNVSSFLDWGVIKQGTETGTYVAGRQCVPKSREHAAWLVEAVLHASGVGQMTTRQLVRHPMLFPFKIEGTFAGTLNANSRLAVRRESVADEAVMLRDLKG